MRCPKCETQMRIKGSKVIYDPDGTPEMGSKEFCPKCKEEYVIGYGEFA